MKNIKVKRRIKGVIDLIRPFTLLAPIIVSSCIMFASLFYNGGSNDIFYICFSIIIPASFALAILNGASNALNQVTDLKSDKISKPYRPIPNGSISIREALVVSLIMYIVAFVLSIFVNLIFTLFIFLITFFTVTYSLKPRMKDKLFFNQIWVGVPRGLLGVLASWCVFGNVLEPLPLAIGFIAMFFLIGGSITKDITDSEADKKTGTHTLVNTYGVKNAAFLALPFMFFPFVFIPILIDCGILGAGFWFLTFLAIPSFFIFYLMFKDDVKSKKFENTSSWTLMYVTYFVFAIGFSIITIHSSISF